MNFLFEYNNIVLPLIILWFSGMVSILFNWKKLGIGLIILGILIFSIFLTNLWIKIDRAPLRTLGETRLWYTIFLSIIGLVMYLKWKIKWIIPFSTFMSILFLLINYFKPENFEKALMPALQSVWFVPHVIVYIFAYSILAATALISLYGLYQIYIKKSLKNEILEYADNIVYIGFSFLTFGLLFGALWAKEAWGHYWTWDPKETWAFITWLLYLIYIHFRHQHKNKSKFAMWILALAFVVLLICWFGINYLPTAANSVHTYTN